MEAQEQKEQTRSNNPTASFKMGRTSSGDEKKKGAAMIHNQWSDTKPKFTEECILLTASWIGRKDAGYWDYHSLLVLKTEDDNGYWLHDMWGEDWGDLADLSAAKYMTIPLLNPKK